MKHSNDNEEMREAKRLAEKSFMFNIVVCIVAVVLCLASLSAVTWAWFTSSVSSASNDVQAGNYYVEVVVSEAENPDVIIQPDENGVYALDDDVKYCVAIAGKGTVSTGFCSVKIVGATDTADALSYTEQIYTEHTNSDKSSIEFELTVDGGGELSVTAYWGRHNEPFIHNQKGYSYSAGALTEVASLADAAIETESIGEETTTEKNIQ